ncbi:hypothetical protein ACFWBA_15510, partial [Streptomyces sp. NPDC059949]
MPRSGRRLPATRPVARAALPAALLALVCAAPAPGATAPGAGAPARAASSAAASSAAASSAAASSAGAAHAGAPRARTFDTAPARAALERLLPRHSGQFTLVPDPAAGAGADTFTVAGTAGAITGRGRTGA